MSFINLMSMFCFVTILVTSFVECWNQEMENKWSKFKETFARNYESEAEEQLRREIFQQNLKIITEHNQKYDQGLSSYSLGVNQYADWTGDEFRHLVVRKSEHNRYDRFVRSRGNEFTENFLNDLPNEVDWTKKGIVTPVGDMGDCGDGYAFGPVGALESAHALATGNLVALSVQQVVDCSMNYENDGCQGGLIDNSFEYMVKNPMDTAESYPYVGGNSPGCQENNKTVGARMKAYVDLPRFNEQTLQSAVARVGPVAISFDADSPHFMLYKDGVYDYGDCNMILIDHGMLVVGYGTLNGKQYWKVKNSMGTKWGIEGYILVARNHDNLCGIASTPSYPVV